MTLQIRFFEDEFSICKLPDISEFDTSTKPFFLARTPDELSLVCPTPKVPKNATVANHDWRAFRVEGALDFNLVGILSSIAQVLASNGISIVALSTYDTDYVLVKHDKVAAAKEALAGAAYEILP